jgi:hypothetical protein
MQTIFQFLKTVVTRIRQKRMAHQHFKQWSKKVRSVDQLSPEEQAIWYEEERSKWQDYYDHLL